jgi:hypothetical protein
VAEVRIVSAEPSVAQMEIGFGPPPRKPSGLDLRFERYHAAHPQVYTVLVRLARQAKEAGELRVGMKALFEVARWKLRVEAREQGFALNNSFTSRYARYIAARCPDLATLFETRASRHLDS